MPTIHLFANLRSLAGIKETPVKGNTIRMALDDLVALFPNLSGVIIDEDRIRPHIIVIVNGQHIDHKQGLDTPVSSSDQIAIFPPIAGG